MAIRPFNSVGGFSVGENPTLIIDANGNVTTTTANLTGNISTYGILTDNYLYANGNPVDFQQAAGGNGEIQYNSNNDFGASSAFSYTSGTLTVGFASNGDIKTDALTVSNSIGAANLNLTGTANVDILTANGNVTANYFIGNGSSLTGLVSNTIFQGSSNVVVDASNVTVSVNGTTNVAKFLETGTELLKMIKQSSTSDQQHGHHEVHLLNIKQ